MGLTVKRGSVTPLVGYYGGKQRLAKKLAALLPPHSVYAEPFAGGAAVFFAKGRPRGSYIEALNDSDMRLYIMYKVAKSQPKMLFRRINSTPYSVAAHNEAAGILHDMEGKADADIAWAVIVKLRSSFGSDLAGGFQRKRASGGSSHPARWANYRLVLEHALARLDNVYLDCVDALEFIKRWDAPQTVFYCDPPYPGAHQGHYGGYSQGEFQALVDTLAQCQASFVLSCYGNAAVPETWRRYEFETKVLSVISGSAGYNSERTEVAWVVDRSVSAEPGTKMWKVKNA